MENEIEKLAEDAAIVSYGLPYEGLKFTIRGRKDFKDGFVEGYKAALSKGGKTFESYLESELTPLGMSDKKTIERALWYYRTYYKPNEEQAALSKGNWTDEDMLGCWNAAQERREAYYADKTYGVPNFEEYLQSLKEGRSVNDYSDFSKDVILNTPIT